MGSSPSPHRPNRRSPAQPSRGVQPVPRASGVPASGVECALREQSVGALRESHGRDDRARESGGALGGQADHVHGHVAPPDHHGAATEQGSGIGAARTLPGVAVEPPGHAARVEHTREVPARHARIRVRGQPGREHHGVEGLAQLVKRELRAVCALVAARGVEALGVRPLVLAPVGREQAHPELGARGQVHALEHGVPRGRDHHLRGQPATRAARQGTERGEHPQHPAPAWDHPVHRAPHGGRRTHALPRGPRCGLRDALPGRGDGVESGGSTRGVPPGVPGERTGIGRAGLAAGCDRAPAGPGGRGPGSRVRRGLGDLSLHRARAGPYARPQGPWGAAPAGPGQRQDARPRTRSRAARYVPDGPRGVVVWCYETISARPRRG